MDPDTGTTILIDGGATASYFYGPLKPVQKAGGVINMKILTISSSPRKGGNSDVLCDRFLKGAQEAGHETEKVRLAEMALAPCDGCYQCSKAKECVHRDGMDALLQKLVDADVIVLATPVYFYSISAQMKIFIDRCLPRYREIKNKIFYFIVTAADPQHSAADETLAGLRGFLRCLPGAREIGTVFGTGAWDYNDVYQHPALNRAYEEGKAI